MSGEEKAFLRGGGGRRVKGKANRGRRGAERQREGNLNKKWDSAIVKK